MQNSLHEIFTNLKSQAFLLHVIVTFWEPTHLGNHASLFSLKFAWVAAKLWWYKIWSVESSFIHSRPKSINSYTGILYDTLSFKKQTIELFHNLPNFRCLYWWRSRNIWGQSTCNFHKFVLPHEKHELLM